MKTYPHVEDYLEVVAGKRDLVTLKAASMFVFDHKPIISLARYDVDFIDNVTNTTMNGSALTDRQAELALKLLLKYRRQLAGKSLDVGPLETAPQFRKPLRQIDRSRACKVEVDKLLIKFPYDNALISTVRDWAKQSQGAVVFDRDAKVWKAALTEYNVNFATAWCSNNGFEIDESVTKLMEQVLEAEATPYAIQLVRDNGQLVIQNAADSLVDFLTTNVGEFSDSNLVKLVDWSSVLGYTVSDELWQEVEAQLDADTIPLMKERDTELRSSTENLTRVIAYAIAANRLPIVVYDPTPNDMFAWYKTVFDETKTLVVGNKKLDSSVLDAGYEVILTHRPIKELDRIPILVSHIGLLVGQDKNYMVNNCEKIVYFSARLSAQHN